MKVVIVHASSGAGHQKAAEAIFKVLREKPEVSVRFIDSLAYTTPLFHFLYPRLYLFLVRSLPSVWGFFYDGLNFALIGPFLRRLRRAVNGFYGKPLEQFFLDEDPDVIVATHFFASEVASSLKQKGKLKARLLTVVTDLAVHSVWVAPLVDGYVVGSVDMQSALIHRGVPREKIHHLGIPIDPVYEKEGDRLSLSHKLGISPETFTVLVASGGFGVGPIEKLVVRLSRYEHLQLLVVCGHNVTLYRRLQEKTASVRGRVILYGFIDNIHELMSVSDCMVSKSGGMMMAEALTKGLPTFILFPIPGQETGNRDVLLHHKVVFSVRNIRELQRRFYDLKRLQKELEDIKQRINQFQPRHTARHVAEYVIGKA